MVQVVKYEASIIQLRISCIHRQTLPLVPHSLQAHTIDLESKLKPFIPDYIPSVGSIDEFIKVPRPDSKPDFLGLKVWAGRVALCGTTKSWGRELNAASGREACCASQIAPLAAQVLDEPASRQSDPTVLTLQLRNLSKEATGNKTDMVGRIEHQDDNKAKKVRGDGSRRGSRTHK